jgi:hypothetical protein
MARSPNYPAHGLREAIELIKQVYDKEKRTVLAGHDVAGALGYSGMSGNARSKIASLKKFDLLDGDETKGMRVSELAVQLLYPASEAEALEAKRKAALAPDLFKTLYEEKKDGSDESIKNYLVSRMEFTPSGAMQAVESFRETLEFASLNEKDYNASSTPDGVEAQPMQTESRLASAQELEARVAKAPHAWYWTLSVPRGVNAQLNVSGPFTKADFGRLKKQIEFLEESFDEEAI